MRFFRSQPRFSRAIGWGAQRRFRRIPGRASGASLGAVFLLAGPVLASGSQILEPVPRHSADQPRVFVLGDSQGFTDFGRSLQRHLLEEGYEVLYHSVKNGTPYYWTGKWKSPVLTRMFVPARSAEEAGKWKDVSMRPRSIREYASIYRPDVFVFQAGTNFETDLARDNISGVSQLIRRCVKDAEEYGARVLWVGPPDVGDSIRSPKTQDAFYRNLWKALAEVSGSHRESCVFDSRTVCSIPKTRRGDGQHPSNPLARDWADKAGAWVGKTVSGLETAKELPLHRWDRFLPELPDEEEEVLKESAAYTMRLRLEAKSVVDDVRTFPYTDAFAVYRYRLLNPEEVLSRPLSGLSPLGNSSGSHLISVLHWVIHNDGSGPALTRVAERVEGEEVVCELVPFAEHPMRDALSTMPQFDDFDDFRSPVFVRKDLLAERSFASAGAEGNVSTDLDHHGDKKPSMETPPVSPEKPAWVSINRERDVVMNFDGVEEGSPLSGLRFVSTDRFTGYVDTAGRVVIEISKIEKKKPSFPIPERKWTNIEGNVLVAEAIRCEEDLVVFRINDREVPYPMVRMSAEDRRFLESVEASTADP